MSSENTCVQGGKTVVRSFPISITRTTPLDELPAYLTVEEAGAVLGIGRSSAYELGRRVGMRVGRLIRIPRAALVSNQQNDGRSA